MACPIHDRPPARRSRAAAVLIGAALAAVGAIGVGGTPVAGAQGPEDTPTLVLPEPIASLRREHRACEAGVDSLLQARALLRQQGDSLGAVLDDAGVRGALDEDRERALLARLGAISETDDVLSGQLRREEARCRDLAADLLSAIRRRLAAEPGALPEGVRQVLVGMRNRLRAVETPAGRIDVALPEASAGDGVDDLRLRAGLARDLADRMRAWVLYVNRQREVVAARRSVEREIGDLLSDQSLLGNDLRGDDLLGTVDQPGGGTAAWLEAGLDAETLATVEQLCAQADLAFETGAPLETLTALAEWLQLRRAAFLLRAERLERDAGRLAEGDRE